MFSKYQPRPQSRFSLLTWRQLAPASSERYTPPCAPLSVRSSTIAQTRLELLGATATPMRPTASSAGRPPVSCFQVSPPSVDLYSPLPGILEGAYTTQGGRRVAHSEA